MRVRWLLPAIILWVAWTAQLGICEDPPAVALPEGVKAVWDLGMAYRDTTPTRERICINGLWQWQPADNKSDRVPADGWGYFKVPGPWPRLANNAQKESQAVYAHPRWKDASLEGVNAAWYQREISVPEQWKGHRVILSLECLNSRAAVYVDGRKAGEVYFPSGEVDLTQLCHPGGRHMLGFKVTALPLRDIVAVFSDSNAPRRGGGTVARRGLCGDVYLAGVPSGARIADVKVDTSVRKGEITFHAGFEGIAADKRYFLRALVTEHGNKVAEFTGTAFGGDDLRDGVIALTETWKPEKLWDIHTPQNMYEVTVSLLDGGGALVDMAVPVEFGFREFWIKGRDFYLNGSRIFLCCFPCQNGEVGVATATYEAAKEGMTRLKGLGVNFLYTNNFNCQPGAHLSYAEILRAADHVGMLVAFTQPHFGDYEWLAANADQNNGYARHAKVYVRVAQNHPSVVFYSMSHNGTGYNEDMNPDMIDGIADPRSPAAQRTVALALRAEAIVHRLDPSRIVYHHASGNLGSMHLSNFYPNFAPIQELCDWFQHWATEGVKPAFTCEYGAPYGWDWAMYRGWYKGKREFGSAQVPWEFCFAEWNAQFLGDRAYLIGEPEKVNLRWENRQLRAGRLPHRWDYPYNLNSRVFDDRQAVLARYLVDNWRAYRTWGLSAYNAWDSSSFWKPREGISRQRKEFPVDWEHLQRPGFSPDLAEEPRYQSLHLDYERSDWARTPLASEVTGASMPLLAYIGGKPAAFTSKDHNFLPGETVEKQLIVINNCRQTVTGDCRWWLGISPAATGTKSISLPTGQQERIPLRFDLPPQLAPGKYELTAAVKFSNGKIQQDRFMVHVLPPAPAVNIAAKIAIWDPKGETARLLDGLGLEYRSVEAGADLAGYDVLIVGKAAMTIDGAGPDVTNVRKGLRVVVFEQASGVLEKRFGFRVVEYGLRNVFHRLTDHPALSGLGVENLHDWRGEATILAPRLKYETNNRLFNGAPTIKWCDIPVTRVWRCGNRGSVASVLIEKPACGNFLPIIDGGYSLQYSPLMEYREGKGVVVFCQVDVTGRTETDPAADRLVRNILNYVSEWKPAANRQALYVGDPAGKSHLQRAGVSLVSYEGGTPLPEQVVIAGPGSGQQLTAHAASLGQWLKGGGHLLGIGLDQDDVRGLPMLVTMKTAEHIAAYFEPFCIGSPMAGVSPADVHNRDPKDFCLLSAGATVVGDGVLATAENGRVVFCQLVPWQCDYSKENHDVKQTFRRASFLVSRLLGNMGVEGKTPVLARFNSPASAAQAEKRWLSGLYLDQPEEWDDPYRFFRW